MRRAKNRGRAPEVFEVVVLARLQVEDVNDHVAVIEGDPLRGGPTLHARGFEVQRQFHPALHLLGDRPHLAVVAPGSDDEGVEGVDELTKVQHHGIDAEFLIGALDRRVDQRSDETILRAVKGTRPGDDLAQWPTPRTMSATTKGMLTATMPATA